MIGIIKINDNELQVKEWNSQRVVTLKDIDVVHQRPNGTAHRNFKANRQHFIKDVDYFTVSRKELQTNFVFNSSSRGNPNIKVTLLTESGYLMVVKSFTDPLAWRVQRDLINCYFKLKEVLPQSNEATTLSANFEGLYNRITTLEETIAKQTEKFNEMCEYITINSKEQDKLLNLARKRINYLLGGTRSVPYKTWSRTYFKNLWLNFCDFFECGQYKDLKPEFLETAKDYIMEWTYVH